MSDSSGFIMHAEMPGWSSKSHKTYGGSAIILMLYVENQSYGELTATFKDPLVHNWTIATDRRCDSGSTR
jgi:hypothetical protein